MRCCIFSVHHSLACAAMAVAASCHVVGRTDGVTSRRWRSVHMCVPFTYCTAAAVVGRRVASHKSSRRCSPERPTPPSRSAYISSTTSCQSSCRTCCSPGRRHVVAWKTVWFDWTSRRMTRQPHTLAQPGFLTGEGGFFSST